MTDSAALSVLTIEPGLARYMKEIGRVPMLEPREEYMLAKRWREQGDRTAAHRLVTTLNTPVRKGRDAGEWQDWLPDDTRSRERVMIQSESFDNSRAALRDSLSVLNSRERRIFEARRIAEKAVPFNELAREFGVSREHVRHIEVRAFEKVQNAVSTSDRRNRAGTL